MCVYVQVAGLAQQGVAALQQQDTATLGSLMNRNFALRRQLFGDAALGATNIRMVELPQSIGCAAKFTGSGGAAVVLCPQGQGQADQLRHMCSQEGFVLVEVEVAPSTVTL